MAAPRLVVAAGVSTPGDFSLSVGSSRRRHGGVHLEWCPWNPHTAPSPIHRGLSLGASGQESPPHTEPSRPHRLASPLRTHSDTGPLPPLSGLPGLRDSPRTTRCHGQRLGCPRHPQDPLEGGTVPCEAPPRGVVPSLRGGLPPLPATVAEIASVRQGPIGSEAGRPPGSLPHPCWIGVPYEAPPCRATPFPALGLSLRARPGTARPGVRPRAQEGGLPRTPPSRRSVSGGPSSTSNLHLVSRLSGLPGHAPGTPRPRI